MKPILISVLLSTIVLGSSCATIHGSRYAYGKSSFYAEALTDDVESDHAERVARAVFGLPLIVGGLGWDALTWPFQVLFGVWPMWGDDSLSMWLD